jgi:xanthine dehydrogenase accessory factor
VWRDHSGIRRTVGLVSQLYAVLRDCLRAEEPVALATVIEVSADSAGSNPGPDGPPRLGAKLLVRSENDVLGSLGDPELDGAVVKDLMGALESGLTGERHYGWRGEISGTAVSVFIEAFTPAPHMVIFGAVDFTRALVRVANVLGYRVTVCDARPVFATRTRFPDADDVVVDWPDRYLSRVGPQLGPNDAICVLTHDAKFDVPAIVGALATNVGYIGAMGSRRTKQDRETRLLEAGVAEKDMSRIMAPIGLDIGARTPEETAVAICAEIIAARSGNGSVASLRDGTGPIHRTPTTHLGLAGP